MTDALVIRLPDDGPAIDPGDGDEAVAAPFPRAGAVVRVEIPVALFRLHQAALVRRHEGLVAVGQLLCFRIRAIDILGAFHHHHAAFRTFFAIEVVIDAIDLIELVRLASA